MRRRLIKQGMGGLTLSLPINWIRARNLKAGDEINIIEESDKLILNGTGESFKVKKILLFSDNKHLLRTLLSAYYRQGYYEVSLEFKEKQPFKLMQDIVSSLRGYDIVSQEKHICIVRDMARDDHESSIILTTKLFQQINLLYTEIYTLLISGKTEYDILILRDNIMKNRDYVQRIIKIENEEYAYELYVLVHAMEKISGEYFHLKDNRYKPEQLKELSKLNEYFNDAYRIFNKKNFSEASSFYLAIRKIISDHKEKAFSNTKNKELYNSEIIIIHNLLTIASRLQIITSLFQENDINKTAV
ncbi:MAG: AbrB/MazE/SpoVT family DNA-binding domain-containing protein [Candidatus Woesearchaeota archaeon]